MKTRILASLIFTGILASSAAQAESVAETKSVNDKANTYLTAAEEIQKQYASYGLDVTREALIRLSANTYPEFAAQQNQAAQKDTDNAYLAAAEEIQKQYAGYGLNITREALIRLSAYAYPGSSKVSTQTAKISHTVPSQLGYLIGELRSLCLG